MPTRGAQTTRLDRAQLSRVFWPKTIQHQESSRVSPGSTPVLVQKLSLSRSVVHLLESSFLDDLIGSGSSLALFGRSDPNNFSVVFVFA